MMSAAGERRSRGLVGGNIEVGKGDGARGRGLPAGLRPESESGCRVRVRLPRRVAAAAGVRVGLPSPSRAAGSLLLPGGRLGATGRGEGGLRGKRESQTGRKTPAQSATLHLHIQHLFVKIYAPEAALMMSLIC